MTEEEAKSMWIENINVSGKVQYYSIIDVIYNYFESRTCENCKYQQHEVCVNDESPMRGDFVSVDYGCNKFEPKEVS